MFQVLSLSLHIWGIYKMTLCCIIHVPSFKSLTTKRQMTEFLSANFQTNVDSKLYHNGNSKTRGQTV